MKIVTRLVLAWALALIVSVSSQAMVKTIALVEIQQGKSATIAFEVNNSSPRGTKYLIRASGQFVPDGMPRLVDPMVDVYNSERLITGNDDWVWNTDLQRLSVYQSKTGAVPLRHELDAAVTITLYNGIHSVVVRGFNGAGGNVVVDIFELPNEAPVLEVRSPLPYIEVGQSLMFSVTGIDEDEDDVEFLFDFNNDGVVDQVSVRFASGQPNWQLGIKQDTPGEMKFRVMCRDAKGNCSRWQEVGARVTGPLKG